MSPFIHMRQGRTLYPRISISKNSRKVKINGIILQTLRLFFCFFSIRTRNLKIIFRHQLHAVVGHPMQTILRKTV